MWIPNVGETVDVIRFGVRDGGRFARGTTQVTVIRKVRGKVSSIETQSGDKFKPNTYGDFVVCQRKGGQTNLIAAMHRHFNSTAELRKEILNVLRSDPRFMGAYDIVSYFGGDYDSATDELIEMEKAKLVISRVYDGECDWRVVEG